MLSFHLLASAAAAAAAVANPASQPNIIYFLVDDLGYANVCHSCKSSNITPMMITRDAHSAVIGHILKTNGLMCYYACSSVASWHGVVRGLK